MGHILIIGKYYPPEFGGVERYAYDLARAAIGAHRVTVLVHNKDGRDSIEQQGDVTVIRCGTNRIVSSQPVSLSMFAHLRALKPDLVQFNAPNFWAAAMLLLTRYDGPLIITHHADVFGRPLLKRGALPIYHRLLRKADCVVVNSLKNARWSSDLPPKTGPLTAIAHGFEPAAYDISPRERETAAMERRRLCGDSPAVGFLGRFVRYKGLSTMIDALARLDSVHALIVGDGPLRSQVEEQAHSAGIADRVHFLGNLDEADKVRALSMMDILLLPSVDTTEAFGVAQIEAQLMGLPVIASHLPTGVSDVTLDNETGLLVPPRDAAALAKAIAKLLSDKNLAARFGRSGREHALKHFTFEVFQQRYRELFDIVLSGRSLEDTFADSTSSQSVARLSAIDILHDAPAKLCAGGQ
jgi:glycosyltransferase involved in cell wall biosynthesis